MAGLLSLLPGFSQASIVMNALGFTKTEKQALDSLYKRIRAFPGFRSMPEAMIPETFESLVTLVLGTAKVAGGNITLPAWLLPVLQHPAIRSGISREVANLIDTDPQRVQLLSVIGKTIKATVPDVDPSSYPGLPELIDGLVIEKLLTLSSPSGTEGHIVACQKCNFQQYMAAIPSNGIVECRACGHLSKVRNHD